MEKYSPPTSRLLADVDALTRLGRTRTREGWFPLLAFGAANLIVSPVVPVIGRGHLGPIVIPAICLAGVACAWHGRVVGTRVGAITRVWPWLVVMLVAGLLGAACSATGRELGSRWLNLAAPCLSLTAGFSVLALWAQSTVLLAVVLGMVIVTFVALTLSDGDMAITLQLFGWGVLMVGSGAVLALRGRQTP